MAQPVRQRLLAVPLHAHLPLGHDARGHVDRDRDRAARARHRDRERVGRQAAVQAAVGHHGVRGRGVGPDEPHEAALGRHLHVVREPADVVRAPDPDRGEPEPRRLVERDLRRPPGDDLAQAEIAVQDGRRRRLGEDAHRRPRVRLALPDRADVLRHADDAVRVVPPEVGADQELRHPAGVVLRHAEGGEDTGRERLQSVGGDGFHVRASWRRGGIVHSSKRPTGYHGARRARARGPAREARVRA